MKRKLFLIFLLCCTAVFLSQCISSESFDGGNVSETEVSIALSSKKPEPDRAHDLPVYPDFETRITRKNIIIQVIAGERFSDFFSRYETAGLINQAALDLYLLTEDFSEYGFLPEHINDHTKFEGIFVPGVYSFSESEITAGDSTDEQKPGNLKTVFIRLLARSSRRYAGMKDIDGINPYQQLVIASITQKEAVFGKYYRDVAAVCYNRFKRGPGARFHMCSTVEYILGYHRPFLLTDDLNSADSRYNTYLYPGLCPTPISFFSDGAFDASQNPSAEEFAYFVVDWPAEEIYFAAKYTDHKKYAETARTGFIKKWGIKNLRRKFDSYYDTGFMEILDRELKEQQG